MKRTQKINLTKLDGWSGKFFFGDNHTYWWDKKGIKHPLSGVTSVLNVIAKPALVPWAAKMTVEYIAKNTPDIELGYSMEEFDQILDEAKKAYQKKTDKAADLGTDAHAIIETYIKGMIDGNSGIPIPIDITSNPDTRLVEFAEWAVARHLKTGFEFVASETPLAEPKLAIAGTPDFIAREKVNDEWVLIIGDLKTGSGIYGRVYFFQMAAYGYMWMKWTKRLSEPKLVIIHCPAQKPNQPLAEYWSEDWKGDWEGFKAALVLHRRVHNFTRPKV